MLVSLPWDRVSDDCSQSIILCNHSGEDAGATFALRAFSVIVGGLVTLGLVLLAPARVPDQGSPRRTRVVTVVAFTAAVLVCVAELVVAAVYAFLLP